MKKVWNCLLFALLSAIIAGCGKAADNISAEGSICFISEDESEIVYDPPQMNTVDMQALPSEESDMPPDLGENLSADALEIKSLAEEILKAYYSGDMDAVQRLLPETYDWDIDVYEGTGTISDITLKGLPETGEQPEGTVLAVSVEHRNSDFDDMLVYLTVELIKQNGRWEIQFYGLEG